MKLHQPDADLFVPDGVPLPEALARTTHLGIGAHQDDLEFMAFPGIAGCYEHPDGSWFGGVTCTDGAGSTRQGAFADFTDAQMREIRRAEQRDAATTGHYAALWQLDYPSAAVKSPGDHRLTDDLRAILEATSPGIVYTHNLADKHDTHVAVAAAAIQAIRMLPESFRPRQLLGCEGWRGLDWLCDEEKAALDVSGHDRLADALNRIFDSQISGGKRYDLAVAGRRAANATFFDSHTGDTSSQVCLAMDLTPLITSPKLDPVWFTLEAVDRFREDVRRRLRAAFPD